MHAPSRLSLSVWASHEGAVFMTPYYRSSEPLRYRSWMYTFDQRSRSGGSAGRDTLARHTVKGHGEELHPCVRDWTWVRDLHRNRSRNHPEATSGVHDWKRERERECKKSRGSAEDRLCTWPPRTRSLAKVEQRLCERRPAGRRRVPTDDLARLCISDFYSSSIFSLRFRSSPIPTRQCSRSCSSLPRFRWLVPKSANEKLSKISNIFCLTWWISICLLNVFALWILV